MVSTRHHPGDFPPPSTPSVSKAITKQDHSTFVGRPWTHTPSTIVILWLLISVPVVLWDTSYVLLRPHSMPGGSLHYLWTPYALYGTVDYTYGWPAYNARIGFVGAQSAMNLVECVCYIYYLAVVWYYGQTVRGLGDRKTMKGVFWFLTAEKSVGGRRGAIALLLAFSAFVMTISKTVLYGFNELFSEFNNVKHNNLFNLMFLWIIPNGLWIVFPSIAAALLGSEIINGLEATSRMSHGGKAVKSKAS